MRRIRWIAVFLVLVMTLNGCGNTAGGENADRIKGAGVTVTPQENAEESSEGGEGLQGNVPESTDAHNLETTQESIGNHLTVYYGDDEAETLLSKTVEVEKIDEDNILSELVNAGVLDGDVELNSCKVQKKKNGVVLLKLDFNEVFQTQLRSYGSAGELLMIGAVVNTFLQAESADKVIITIEGDVLETGHTIYDEPLVWYDFS